MRSSRETTFTTSSGSVRVTDAMLLGSDQREVIRVVDPREGRVRMRWRFEPRFDVGLARWDAGDDEFELGLGSRATFVVAESPPTREDAERRLERTAASWMDWAARARYEGRWHEPVLRSALALKLLSNEPFRNKVKGYAEDQNAFLMFGDESAGKD